MRRLCFLLLVVNLSACDLNMFRKTPVERGGFAPALKVDTTAMQLTASGLRYQDLKVGDGQVAMPGMLVDAGYTGWLTNGRQFDAGHYQFVLGAARVIAGWDEGVAGMKVGGKRKLVVPPALGYGPNGSPPVIPPDATLVFDVELLSVAPAPTTP